ncbi:hypothetical protein [Paenibacillus sp. MMS20-IR301]|uniref:hypothetical protein n=1 Tax=Paenibacillus sp. MMS20-IR301 TaxID=2895946 RepID=UPI0028EBA7A5|nr:hypothetical protein [Paenibacillus sp. MMS20-IR301]WNS40852.1 hypothetical protein LOS79_17520 [Paenibacillus sp. MMS20-IR301]
MSGKKNQRKHVADSIADDVLEQDENFYFIAGYTEGGAPFGITWEEHEAESQLQPLHDLKLRSSK